MILIISIILFVFCFTYIQSNGGEINAYSSVNKELSRNKCFKYSNAKVENSSSALKVASSITYSELKNIFSKFYSYSVVCSRNRSGRYLREIKQKKNTFNINYLFKMYGDVAIEYNVFGEDLLNDYGKKVYNGGNNPFFRTICGDHIITRGKVEYMLSFNFHVEVDGYDTREEIFGDAPTDDVNKAADKIMEKLNKLGFNGSASVNALQIGGDETQLQKFLGEGKESLYKANCNMKDFTSCKNAMTNLLDYAVYDFPDQITNQNANINLDGLLSDQLQKISISNYDLYPKALKVSPEDNEYRNEIMNFYFKNDYYNKELNRLLESYIGLFKYDKQIKQIDVLLKKVEENYKLLEPESEIFEILNKCYINPNECKNAAEVLREHEYNFNEDELLEAGCYHTYSPKTR